MKEVTIVSQPILSGQITVPGDKFISQTSVILASFAQGKTQIKGFLMHGECTKIVDALATLGVIIERYTPDILIVHGRLGNNLKEPSSIIDMDDSEVGLKLIIGILSAQPFFSVVCGNEYLCRQSIKNIIASLTQLGATIFGRQNNVYPPVAIKGGHLHTTDFDFYKLDPYAKSTILLAALSGNVSIKIKESVGSWDHTERMIQQFGGDIQKENNKIILGNNNKLLATDIIIPGDFFFGSLFTGLLLLIIPDSHISWSWHLLPAIYVGLTEMAVAFVCWLTALQHTTSHARISNLVFISPFLALFFIHLILGESIYWTTPVGLIFIVGGILMQQLFHSKKTLNV